MITGPSIKKGRSRQDYETPMEFIQAVEKRFGPLDWDLAASAGNAKAAKYFTIEQNSLEQDWTKLEGNLWLNPPYGVIGPWVKKASLEWSNKSRILMLLPAAVGSNWFKDYVFEKCLVLFLSPRIQFDGADDPYPKDLMLLVYGGEQITGFECWRWK